MPEPFNYLRPNTTFSPQLNTPLTPGQAPKPQRQPQQMPWGFAGGQQPAFSSQGPGPRRPQMSPYPWMNQKPAQPPQQPISARQSPLYVPNTPEDHDMANARWGPQMPPGYAGGLQNHGSGSSAAGNVYARGSGYLMGSNPGGLQRLQPGPQPPLPPGWQENLRNFNPGSIGGMTQERTGPQMGELMNRLGPRPPGWGSRVGEHYPWGSRPPGFANSGGGLSDIATMPPWGWGSPGGANAGPRMPTGFAGGGQWGPTRPGGGLPRQMPPAMAAERDRRMQELNSWLASDPEAQRLYNRAQSPHSMDMDSQRRWMEYAQTHGPAWGRPGSTPGGSNPGGAIPPNAGGWRPGMPYGGGPQNRDDQRFRFPSTLGPQPQPSYGGLGGGIPPQMPTGYANSGGGAVPPNWGSFGPQIGPRGAPPMMTGYGGGFPAGGAGGYNPGYSGMAGGMRPPMGGGLGHLGGGGMKPMGK